MPALFNHVLSSQGVNKTLADWGISQCVVTTTLGCQDSLQITLPASADGSPLFPYWQPVDLYDSAGVRRFRGWNLSGTIKAAGKAETHTYTFSGPWQTFLDRATFVDTAQYAVNPADEVVNLEQGPTSEIILSRDLLSGTKISLGAMIEKALDFCITAGAKFTYSATNLPVQFAPEDEKSDRSCGEVVKSALRYAPTYSCAFDYTANQPTLHFGDVVAGTLRRAPLPGQTAAPETLDFLNPPSWAPGLALKSFSWDALPGLQISSVSIIYVFENNYVQAGNTTKWDSITVDSASVANGAFGSQTSTVRLRGTIWDGSQWTAPEPIPPVGKNGLAQVLLRQAARLQYKMSFTTVAQEIDWVHGPGELWNVANAAPELLTANSILQSITRDLAAGTVSYQTGPAGQINEGDLYALLKPFRLRTRPKHAGEMQHGIGEPDNDPPANTLSQSLNLLATQQNPDLTLSSVVVSLTASNVVPYTGV